MSTGRPLYFLRPLLPVLDWLAGPWPKRYRGHKCLLQWVCLSICWACRRRHRQHASGCVLVSCVAATGASKVVAGLQTFKVKYAEARAKDHPELQSVYTDKIAAMKKAGETHRWRGHNNVGPQSYVVWTAGSMSFMSVTSYDHVVACAVALPPSQNGVCRVVHFACCPFGGVACGCCSCTSSLEQEQQ